MIGEIIWYVTLFGCAIMFCGIGAYAGRLEKPMWFWAGTEVDPSGITDVKAYNQENAKMWKAYSLWFWIAGILMAWSSVAALFVLAMGGTLGIVLLVVDFTRIEKKYKSKK